MGSDVMAALQLVCANAGVDEWGVAANRDWPLAPDLPFAVALVGRHAPDALSGLEQTHMSQAFFDDYARLWRELDDAAAGIIAEIEAQGHTAVQSSNLMAGPHDDPPVEDWGDPGVFSHKIAATQAGLGWIGKTAAFVSVRFGTAVRRQASPSPRAAAGTAASASMPARSEPAGTRCGRPACRATSSMTRRPARPRHMNTPSGTVRAACVRRCARSRSGPSGASRGVRGVNRTGAAPKRLHSALHDDTPRGTRRRRVIQSDRAPPVRKTTRRSDLIQHSPHTYRLVPPAAA
jgi:hypothetical protein